MHTKTLILSALLSAAMLPMPAAAEDWNAPQAPFAIFGNTYYVGVRGLSSVLITSAAGHILIDGGSPKSPRQIVRHIRQLGFKVEDIKYILNSHEHFDHAGGIAEMQRLSGATVLASAQGEQVLRTGLPSKGDPQYVGLQPMIAVANTRVVRDLETVTLGPLSVTAHYTPGHTQGGVSWTWRSTEGSTTASMVYADSLTAISAEPFRYSGNTLYPGARADIEKSIATIAALDCDVLVSAHPEVGELWVRKEQQARLGNKAFIDAHACSNYAAKARVRLASTLVEEAARK